MSERIKEQLVSYAASLVIVIFIILGGVGLVMNTWRDLRMTELCLTHTPVETRVNDCLREVRR